MSLDVFAGSIAAADQNVARNAAPDLPAEFSETFDIAMRRMGEWNSSAAYSNARDRALASFYDDVKTRTGVQLPLYQMGGNVTLDDLNEAIGKIATDHPDQGFLPLSEADVDTMARRRMAAAHDDADQLQRRETTWGGTAGTVAGTLIAGLSDPVQVATLPLGGAGTGIALRALEFAAIAGGTEAANAAMNHSVHEAAVPGSSKEAPGEIAAATLFGGALGAGFGVLGKLLGNGAKPLPTSIRDEVNAATSEAQFHVNNPFPTAAGEAAARDAHVDATRAMLRGDVVTAGERFDAAHVADYAAASKAETPEAFALVGEKHLRPETIGDVPDVERFDVMPREADDAVSYWESRIAGASPEERAALGATDNAVEPVADGFVRLYHGGADPTSGGPRWVTPYPEYARDFRSMGEPNEVHYVDVSKDDLLKNAGHFDEINDRPINFEAPEDIAKRLQPFGEVPREAIPAADVTAEQLSRLAADPATESSVLHNLEHIADANPDMEFTTQIRQPDGSYQFTTQKLSDVMADLDGWETAAREIEACAVGGALEAAE